MDERLKFYDVYEQSYSLVDFGWRHYLLLAYLNSTEGMCILEEKHFLFKMDHESKRLTLKGWGPFSLTATHSLAHFSLTSYFKNDLDFLALYLYIIIY